ncbi:hypothetical protein ACXR2U_23235 [Jatrophihabitans sp. YIM 134969]
MSAKRNAFVALGWLVWKLLALVGVPVARRKLEERRVAQGRTRRREAVTSLLRRRR